MKTYLRGFLFGSAVAISILLVMAANPSFDDFNIVQFRRDANTVSIRALASVTNLVVYGTAVVPSALVSTTPGQLLTSVANSAGILTNDGSGALGFNTDIGSATTTNTVINSTTINVTTQIFNVAKGATLTITNGLTPLQVGASKVVGTAADGSLTNLDGVFTTRGSILYRNATVWTPLVPSTAGYVLTDGGVGADPAWAAAAAGGGASTWIPVTALAFSTTNVTIPLNGGTNFLVTLTNGSTGFFTYTGAPASTSTNATFTLTVVQDATGTRAMNWNTNFYFMSGSVPVCTTNAGAEDVFTLTASARVAGAFNVTWNPDFKR